MSKRKSKSHPITLRQKLGAEMELEKIKKLLAADKRRWGVFDDSRGLRYLSPALYIKLEDYAVGLKYLKWFERNFPDDIGMPDFLLECAIILFKSGKIKEAEQKIYQTWFSNTYLLDAFFGKPLIPIVKWEGSNWEAPEYTQYLNYDCTDLFLTDFTEWLKGTMNKEEFKITSEKYITVQIKLKFEKDQEMRSYLLAQIRQLESKSSV